MEIDIELSSADITKAIIYSHLRNKFIWAMCILPAVLINSVSVVGLWAMGWPLAESLSVATDFVYWVLGLYLVGLFLTILSLVANPIWRKGRVGPHKIELTEKGIVESTQYNRSEMYWPSIRKVSVTFSGLYFLYAGSDSFLIPRRSFPSENAWREFEDKFFSLYLQAQ